MCITPSAELAQKVQGEVARQLAELPRADLCRPALDNYGAVEAGTVRGGMHTAR